MTRGLSYVCISMKHAIDRRENMAEQFRLHGIDGRFFDGIDISAHTGPIPGYSEASRKFFYGSALTKGQIGCYLSHREVWKQLIASGDEAWCIMEDDISFLSGFKATTEELYMYREHWDIVRLYGIFKNPQIEYASLPSGTKLMWMDTHPLGTQCYVVTRNAAQRLLRVTERIRVPIDDALDQNWKHELRLYITSPEFVRDEGFDSTIGKLDSRQSIPYRILVKPFRRMRKIPQKAFNSKNRPTGILRLGRNDVTGA
jgi:glycosyl transferase, family 25|nr:MAG TPA: hypothetical protein [Caudoviricetes sp.]